MIVALVRTTKLALSMNRTSHATERDDRAFRLVLLSRALARSIETRADRPGGSKLRAEGNCSRMKWLNSTPSRAGTVEMFIGMSRRTNQQLSHFAAIGGEYQSWAFALASVRR